MENERKNLRQLAVPMGFETLFYQLAGMVDTLMLSTLSDEAVGAVGTVNTYLGVFIIMLQIVSNGMTAVMTQYIGAKREGIAYQARQLGFLFNTALGTALSAVLFFGAGALLRTVGIADSLLEPAQTYMRIVGGGLIISAPIPIFSNYLNAFGHAKLPLAASLIGNILNCILNAVFLFALDLGVAGIAMATVISRVVNVLIVATASHLLIHAGDDPQRLPNREVFGQILKIGLPAALETGLYNAAMALVIRFLNKMDADGINVTARSYAAQIAMFSYCTGVALANANAILTGWRIGAKEYEKCDKGTKQAVLIGICVAVVLDTIFALSSGTIMRIFTDDPAMIALVGKLLFIDIVLEIGRAANMIFGNALKTSGDALFTMVIAVIFMYLCAVGGTYVFGIKMGLLAAGAYIGMAMDECARAVCMFLRWQSGKWKEKGLISR